MALSGLARNGVTRKLCDTKREEKKWEIKEEMTEWGKEKRNEREEKRKRKKEDEI